MTSGWITIEGDLSAVMGTSEERTIVRAFSREVTSALAGIGRCDTSGFGNSRFELGFVTSSLDAARPVVERVLSASAFPFIQTARVSVTLATRPVAEPTAGDLFIVPLSDGTFAVGQVFARESVGIAIGLFDHALTDAAGAETVASSQEHLIACLLATPDKLEDGIWRIVGTHPIAVAKDTFSFAEVRRNGWVAARVLSSGAVRAFLEAFHGLRPWHAPGDAVDFLESMLLPDRRRRN